MAHQVAREPLIYNGYKNIAGLKLVGGSINRKFKFKMNKVKIF